MSSTTPEPGDLRVLGKDLRVGDRLVGWQGVNGRRNFSRVYTVTRIDELGRVQDDSGNIACNATEQVWIRARALQQEGIFGPPSAVASAPKKVVKEYPDNCTRCGRPAYVGMFEVTHENETAARDCPARRK